MHRLAGLFAAFVDPAADRPFARAGAGQEPHRVRRGLDEERARRHRRRLHRQDRRQDRRQLCRELGAGQADRTGRAGRYLRLRRHRLDGLCDRQEEHQRADPGQPARQQHRADRAEGFQDRQCRRSDQGFDLAKLAGDGKIATGDVKSVPVGKYAKAALEKLGAWQRGGAEIRDGRERARRADAGGARRSARSASSMRPTPRSSPASRSSAPSRPIRIPPIIYPVAATTTAKPEAADYLAFLRSSAAKTIFEKYGFTFLVSPTT